MKTIEALYNEVLENDSLKKEFSAAVQGNRLEAFLKENGCDAGEKEVQAFLAEKQSREGAISDAELGNASGGCNGMEATMSVVTVGIGCAAIAAESKHRKGEYGDDDESGKILCEAYNWND